MADSKGKSDTKTDITQIINNFNLSKEYKSVLIDEIADSDLI